MSTKLTYVCKNCGVIVRVTSTGPRHVKKSGCSKPERSSVAALVELAGGATKTMGCLDGRDLIDTEVAFTNKGSNR